MNPKISKLPKNFFVVINNQKELACVIDHLKPVNASAFVIGVLSRGLNSSLVRGSTQILRYKNNKVDFGYVERDYNFPTFTFKNFKKLTNSSRNSK